MRPVAVTQAARQPEAVVTQVEVPIPVARPAVAIPEEVPRIAVIPEGLVAVVAEVALLAAVEAPADKQQKGKLNACLSC